jgi:hypothetical protein
MKTTSTRAKPNWLFRFLVIFCLAGSTGCQSIDHPSTSNLASVVITGNTPGQIRDAAVEVFVDNGYKATQTDPTSMVFEKHGSGMNNFAHGNWVGDTPVWVRVKASITAVGEMKFRLQCGAYLVRDRGSAAEEELTVNKIHKGKYKQLLLEVAKRFEHK